MRNLLFLHRSGIVAGVLLLAATARGGLGFGEPRPLNTNSFTDSRNDFSCEIATDGQGVWLAVWHGAEPLGDTGGDTDLIYARSTDNGDSWTVSAKFNALVRLWKVRRSAFVLSA